MKYLPITIKNTHNYLCIQIRIIKGLVATLLEVLSKKSYVFLRMCCWGINSTIVLCKQLILWNVIQRTLKKDAVVTHLRCWYGRSVMVATNLMRCHSKHPEIGCYGDPFEGNIMRATNPIRCHTKLYAAIILWGANSKTV